MLKSTIAIVFQMKESLLMAASSFVTNKVRTLLTLFGITIGIVSIIAAFTVIDSLRLSIQQQFDSLGSNVVYVQSFSFVPEEGDTEYKWWEYLARPKLTHAEFRELKRDLGDKVSGAAYQVSFRSVLKSGKEHLTTSVNGVTEDYYFVMSQDLEQGRVFTPVEYERGARVAILGFKTAEKLFPEGNPIGKKVKIKGINHTVVGVNKRAGNSMFGDQMDYGIGIPYLSAKGMTTVRSSNPTIALKAADGVSNADLKDATRFQLKKIRRLSPLDKPNFALNELSQISSLVDAAFVTINLAGLFIGLFSIVIGAMGVANIMFVSVLERTPQIGIQKALGAKSYSILATFLYESVFLSLLGGIIGLLIVYGLIVLANQFSPFEIVLTMKNMIIGIGISVVVGVVAGFLPALNASRLDPVKAIYSN